MVVHVCIPSYIGGIHKRIVVKLDPIQKVTKAKKGWVWGMAQVVKHLPSKCNALSSNSRTTKKKKKHKNKK
jgi:hypothetical protein